MAGFEERKVSIKNVQTTMLNCVQKVSSSNNKRLWQLNKAYKDAKHDLELLEQIGAITKKEVEETINKMRYQYVEHGLKLSEGYEN